MLSYERALVAHYVVQSPERREEILAEAIRNPKLSGPLIQAYRYLL